MMNSLGDILRHKNLNSPLVRGVRAAQIISATEKALTDLFGPEIKDHAAPAYYKNQTLTIACLSSIAAQEIRLRETALLETVRAAVPGVQISKIRYLS